MNFWKGFRRLNGKVINTSNYIDDESNPDEILKIFINRYKRILDVFSCQSIRSSTRLNDYDLNYKLLSLRSFDTAIGKINVSICTNGVYTHF